MEELTRYKYEIWTRSCSHKKLRLLKAALAKAQVETKADAEIDIYVKSIARVDGV